jgi:serine phosphatase RsbU (regulator of sigma subunit)
LKKRYLIVIFFLTVLLAKAQHFNPEAYVIYNVSLIPAGELVNPKSGPIKNKTAVDEHGFLKKLDQTPIDTSGEIGKIKLFLTQSANNSVSGKYKLALENALLASRLSLKANHQLASELSALMQATIYYRLNSFKNEVVINQNQLKNPEVIFQISYLTASSYFQLGNYIETETYCTKINNDQSLSNYDKIQVLKLTAKALEKSGNYLESLKVTDLANKQLATIKESSFQSNCNQKLVYYTINEKTFSQKILIEQLTLQNNTAFLLLKNNDLKDAESAFLKALKLAKDNKEKEFELQIEKNTGLTYTLLKQYSKAEDFYVMAEKLADKEYNLNQKAELLCIRAKNIYLSGNLSLASELCRQSIDIAEKQSNYGQLSQSYSVLSEINAFVGDIQKATNYSKLAEENAIKAKNLLGNANQEELVNNMKEEVAYDVFSKEKAELELIQFKLEATRRTQELEIIKRESQIKESNLIAQRLESEKSQQSLLMIKRELETVNQLQELEQIKKDRAINILENKNNQTKIRLLNKQRKLDSQIKLQREKDVKRAKTREQNLRIFLLTALIIIGLIVFLLYRNVRNSKIIKSANKKLEELTTNLTSTNAALQTTIQEVNTKNEIIEAKNHQILESITYAKRIQEASLPKADELLAVAKDSFVLNKPKDIISGDFYIVSSLSNQTSSDLSVYIVGDCTGHGVPGAMLSLLCSSLVRQSMTTNRQYTPAQLLDDVNEKLRNFFRNKADDSFKDGMDIGCCLVDRKNNKLYFASAGRPLLHLRDTEITELKGEKHHIGFSGTNFNFINQEMDVKSGDSIYLYTDGYTDQFNGTSRKRFMTKNLKDLLVKLSHEPMSKQGELLNTAFEDWRGDYVQMDDVCVLGIKI